MSSTGTPPESSESTGSSRVPARQATKPSNGYKNWVAQMDPHGTMDNGRGYVGGKSHHIEKPPLVSKSTAPKPEPVSPLQQQVPELPSSRQLQESQAQQQQQLSPPQQPQEQQEQQEQQELPPPQQQQQQQQQQSQPQPPQRQQQPQPQLQQHSQQQPNQLRPTNFEPRSLHYTPVSAQPRSYKQQNLPTKGKSGGNVGGNRKAGREVSQSRWSGKHLVTASSMPDDFFSTAKPITPQVKSMPDDFFGTAKPATSQTKPMPNTSNASWGAMPTSSTGPSTSLSANNSSWGSPKMQHASTPVMWPQSAGSSGPGSSRHQREAAPYFQPHSRDEPNIQSNYYSPPYPNMPSAQRPSNSARNPNNGSGDLSASKYASHHGHEASPKQPTPAVAHPEEGSGEHVVIRYPIGDGCWVSMAIFVDRDARTASNRFEDLRMHQVSGIKEKSPMQIGEIVAEAVDDMKSNLLK